MRIQKIITIVLFMFCICSSFAQKPNIIWTNWKPLIGEWVGEGNGQPGNGNGSFSFRFDLDNSVIIRKSHTEFPATSGRPAFTHDDLLIIYPDDNGLPKKAIYFDNEVHTINYSIEYTSKSIVLTSVKIADKPCFRLTYEIIDDLTVNVKFEMSTPQKQDDFKIYLEGKSIKKK